jgi:hypothetical protein
MAECSAGVQAKKEGKRGEKSEKEGPRFWGKRKTQVLRRRRT